MGARILIVEDEEKLARFVELELQHEGYETEKVMNGRDALDTALSSHFDLILLDIMLPGLNGLEEEEGVFVRGKLSLNTKKHRVLYDGHEITLTNREFLLLQTLLENMDLVLSRDTLLEKVCGYEYAGETNVIDVYVRFLRSKIDEVFGEKVIETVRGVGYVIKRV